MGAVILPLMGLYFVLLIVAARLGWRFAEKRAWKKRWLGAVLGFLIVYLPVLGDWIPTVLAHKYYCANEAGFWEYKTLDQWKAENPGVFETLDANHLPEEYRVKSDNSYLKESEYLLPDGTKLIANYYKYNKGEEVLAFVEYKKPDGSYGYQLNERFRSALKERGPFLFNQWKIEKTLVDTKTDEVLARYVDFFSGDGRIGGEPPLRFWLQEGYCKRDHKGYSVQQFIDQFTGAEK